MNRDALTPDQQAQVAALEAEFKEQLERGGVDMPAAVERLRNPTAVIGRDISGEETELTIVLDVSRIIATLRELPAAAGTDAFVAAYNARAEPPLAGNDPIW